jgi:hypothetical protein
MQKHDGKSNLPAPVTPPKLLHQGFVWIRSRGNSIRTHRFSGVSSVLMAPIFFLEFLFLALLIAIILLIFGLYITVNMLLSLPRLKKGT